MEKATSEFVRGLIVNEVRVPPGVDWGEALTSTLRFRLGGVAWRLAGRDGRVPARVRERWEGAHRAQALAGALLLDELAALRVTLRNAGIAPGVIKGVQLLESRVHPLGARAVDDVDLVVSRDAAPAAIEALTEAGWVPWSRRVAEAPGWAPAATFESRGAGRHAGLSVDLHWDADYGALRYRGLASEPPFDVRGWLSPERHLVLLLEHVLKHLRFRTHLVGLTDVVELAPYIEDWDGFAHLLRGSVWFRPAAALLEGLAAEASPAVVPPGVLAPAPAWLRRRLALPSLVVGAGVPLGRLEGLLMRWGHLGLGSSIRDVRDVLAPPSDWLSLRYRSARPGSPRIHHLGRLMRWAVGIAPSPLSPNGDA